MERLMVFDLYLDYLLKNSEFGLIENTNSYYSCKSVKPVWTV